MFSYNIMIANSITLFFFLNKINSAPFRVVSNFI
jgi:hypothetical protein